MTPVRIANDEIYNYELSMYIWSRIIGYICIYDPGDTKLRGGGAVRENLGEPFYTEKHKVWLQK